LKIESKQSSEIRRFDNLRDFDWDRNPLPHIAKYFWEGLILLESESANPKSL